MASTETGLGQAQNAIMAGQFEDALVPLTAMLSDPDQPRDAQVEAHYMTAVCHRYLKNYAKAHEVLENLKAISPELGRAWQEEGHLLRDQRKMSQAASAYEAAVRFNPALDASWSALARVHANLGNRAAGEQAGAQAARLKTLPRPLLAVMHHLYEGRMLKAEDLCRAFLQKRPRDVEAMRLLAEIGVRMSVLDDAEVLLSAATQLQPDNVQLRLDYIQILRKRQKFAESLTQSEALMARDTANPTFLSNVAIDRMHMGDFESAVHLFDQVLALVPNDPTTLTSKGHALKTWGKQDGAVSSYKAAIARKPDHGDAWYGLANLKTYTFTDAERKTMQASLVKGQLLPADHIHLAFAAAKASEDLGDYEAAFTALATGNQLKKRTSRYDADQMHQELTAQARIADAPFFEAAAKGGGCTAPDPIFIVGLPRAGSTLIEQILASHSQIDGTLELPHILQTAHGLRGRLGANRYPDALTSLSDEEARALGEAYIENTKQYRGSAPFFTDKMPNNFRHIGLIKRILPNARIIDARRDAMGCCFSGYKQLFAEGQEFTYSLSDIGRYYRDYVDLMDHFDAASPGMVLRVQYEDVVADLEPQVRRMLDYLNLPFEEACVNFHKTERAVRTASSEQVREKINTKGIKAWAPYAQWLGPLADALGPDLAPDLKDLG